MIMPFPYRDQRQAFPTWVHGNVGMGSSRRKGEGDNGICWDIRFSCWSKGREVGIKYTLKPAPMVCSATGLVCQI